MTGIEDGATKAIAGAMRRVHHAWLIAVCGCAQLGRSVPSPGRRAVEGGRWVCSVLEWAAARMGRTAPAKRRACRGYEPRYRSRGTRPVHNSPSLWRLRWVPRHTSAVYTVEGLVPLGLAAR